MFSYYMHTHINFGRDCLSRLVAVLKSNSVRKILVITGGKSAKISGALGEVKNKLSDYKLIIFEGIEPNPDIKSLDKGIGLCKKEKADLVVAVGGGSVIDYGKAVSVLSREKADLHEFFYKRRKLKGNKIIFIAVPTTFGTSSEITPYAVMTDEIKEIKITLADKSMFPDYAFTDPKFTLTMAKPLVAASCADLFSHAVEAYWNVNATELTDLFAYQAIKLFLDSYKQTFDNSRDLRARERISLAGLYAGLAFSNTRTTACHAVSYPLTTIFNIPHGIASILTMAEVLEFNYQSNKSKILKLCRLMNCRNVKEAKRKIKRVLDDLKIKARLRDYNLSKNDLRPILEKGFTPERMANNPRKLRKGDLNLILQKIY